jgi:WD40 repeat protein/tRNA A-37 threonylcarbamoyl transferase component Bud32
MPNSDLNESVAGREEGRTLEELLSWNDSDAIGLMVLLNLLQRDQQGAKLGADGLDWFATPRALGRFKLESLLGRGAFGAVFQAFDTKLLRRVALKVAWPHVLMHPVGSRRFNDESTTLAALKHPGIVEVFDSAEVGVISYIALELVDGPNLAAWTAAQTNVPMRVAMQIVNHLARTIHFAHENGVVHRDLKPNNILLRPCRIPGLLPFETVITDFGLARGPRPAELSSVTGTTDVIGTDYYMSPEQAAGLADQVGPASDIFSLGVILYELVTGRRPFDGKTSEDVRRQICNAEPPSIGQLGGSTTRDLNAIIGKCLEKSFDRRYRTSQELAFDLQRSLDGRPIHAGPILAWRRSWKLARRHPLICSFIAMVCLGALLLGGFASAWMRDRQMAFREVAAAKATASETEETERQHRYDEAIQRAAISSRRGNRAETLEFLQSAASLAHGQVQKGVEWDVLSASANDSDKTIGGLSTVRDIEFAPGGDLLASTGAEGLTTLWNVGDWSRRRVIVSGVLGPRLSRFSQDGSMLAVVGDNGHVAIHRVENGSRVFKNKVNAGRIFAAAWLGASSRLAVGGDTATLHVIDVASGQQSETAPLPLSADVPASEAKNANEIIGLAYIADRNLIGVLKSPSEVQLIDGNTLNLVGGWATDLKNAGAICHIPVGPGYFAIGSAGGEIILHDVDTGKKAASIPVSSIVSNVRYSSSTNMICAGFWDGSTQAWPIAPVLAGSPTAGHRFKAHSGRTLAVDLSPNGEWFASGGRDCKIRLWRWPTKGGSTFTPLAAPPQALTFSPCGRWLSICERTGERRASLKLVAMGEGRMLWSDDVQPLSSGANYVAFDSSGNELVLIEADGSVCSRNTQSGKVIKAYIDPHRRADNVWFSAGGKNMVLKLMTQSGGQKVLVIDREQGTSTDSSTTSETFLGVFQTTDGDLWISTDSSHQCLLRRKFCGPILRKRYSMPERPSGATVSDDGRYLAAWGASHTIYLWDVRGGPGVAKLVGHNQRITALLFTPDSRTLLSHDGDNTVRFWDTKTHNELLSLGSRDEQVLSMALHPTAGMLVLGIERDKQFGLRVYRFKDAQEGLPSTFELGEPAPTEQVGLE